jgi:hypothetical protein
MERYLTHIGKIFYQLVVSHVAPSRSWQVAAVGSLSSYALYVQMKIMVIIIVSEPNKTQIKYVLNIFTLKKAMNSFHLVMT